MNPFLDALKIEFTCKACGNRTKQTIEWIKSHNEFSCQCGEVFRFDMSDFKTQIADADRRFAMLKSTITDVKR